MKAQEDDDISFDLPPGVGGKLDVSREHSLRGAPGSIMSPDSSRDGTSVSGSETHMVSVRLKPLCSLFHPKLNLIFNKTICK